MAVSFANIVPKHERRFRVLFSDALGAGAFLPGPYTVTSQDSLGVSPNVLAAYPIAQDPNVVELVLDADLAAGGLYLLTMTGVPGTSGPAFTGTQEFRVGVPQVTSIPNTESKTDDIMSLLYGEDLVWSGSDYLETADGDLDTISGIPNAEGAIMRRVSGDPLPWDDDYSARAGQYVDGPPGTMPTLRAALIEQTREDDRVAGATCSLTVDNEDADATFELTVDFVGAPKASAPFSVSLSQTDLRPGSAT